MALDLRKREIAPTVVGQAGSIQQREQHLVRIVLFGITQLAPLWRLVVAGYGADSLGQADPSLVPGQRGQQQIQRDIAREVPIEATQNAHATIMNAISQCRLQRLSRARSALS